MKIHIKHRNLLAAAVLLLAFLTGLTSGQAAAQTAGLNFSGVLTEAVDYQGLFAPPGTNLSGLPFAASISYLPADFFSVDECQPCWVIDVQGAMTMSVTINGITQTYIGACIPFLPPLPAFPCGGHAEADFNFTDEEDFYVEGVGNQGLAIHILQISSSGSLSNPSPPCAGAPVGFEWQLLGVSPSDSFIGTAGANATLVANGPRMGATFVAPNLAMPPSPPTTAFAYAQACGFSNFNWQQLITENPGGSCTVNGQPYPECVKPIDINDNLKNIGPDGSLMAGYGLIPPIIGQIPPSYFDPILGGYTYQADFSPYPFYYLMGPNGLLTQANGSADVSADGTTLSFHDLPAQHSLPGDPPSTNPLPGTYLAFSTSLVGVSSLPIPGSSNCDPTGKVSALYCSPLYTWTWNTTYNGQACPGVLSQVTGLCLSAPGGVTITGIDQTSGDYPIIPGSGTGGVTVTNINGVQLPTAVSSSEIVTTASGLAYSRVSQTFNGTVTLTNIGSAAISGPLQILFTGMPAGVTLANATGDLSGTPYLTVPAVASLAPNRSVTVSVKFQNPSNATIDFTPAIYSGSIG